MLARVLLFVVALALCGGITTAQAANVVQNDITRATLIADTDAINAGTPFTAGVLLEHKKGWHSYWENPGDAGLATTLTWNLPQDFSATSILWPAPERINEGPLTIYGYHDAVLLPVTITPPATLNHAEIYSFSVKAEWLVCADICIPESAVLDMAMPVGTPNASIHAERFASQAKSFPKKLDDAFTFTHDHTNITIDIPLEAVSMRDLSAVQFFVREQNALKYATMQNFTKDSHSLNITIAKSNTEIPANLSGVLTLENKDGKVASYEVSLAKGNIVAPTANNTQSAGQQDIFLPFILLLAVLGGLILNLMPCVLPVLSLKALAILKKSGKERSETRKHGIAYTLGILVSFGLLAGFLISLQQAGEHVGWGYQMQSPVFVGFLIYLLFLVGLNLSGMFDLPVLLGNTGSELANESSTRGSFFTGVLATAVATPCTAPFMASAVGVALTLPAWQAFMVFEALAFGLALPFLLISFFPALLRFLPKPGAWMESFKQLLAFPMYASVIWLLWVITLQTSNWGMVVILSSMVIIVLALWTKRLFTSSSTHHWFAAIAIFAIIAGSLWYINTIEPDQQAMVHQDVTSVPYSPEGLTKLRAEGKAVFINATAAWCITCQVNAKTTIHTQAVMDAFKQQGITYMVADWTRRNAQISDFLKGFGYQGVPLYVFYPAGGEPVVLPQVLTPTIILDTINNKGDHS